MTGWVRCTNTLGKHIFVNMANAMSVTWQEKQQYSIIAFQGGAQDTVTVKENPELILSSGWTDIT